MRRCVYVLMAACLAVIAAVDGHPVSASSRSGSQTGSSPSPGSQRALVDRYCVTCHNQRLKTGGLALDTVDLANVGARAGDLGKGRAQAARRRHAARRPAAAGQADLRRLGRVAGDGARSRGRGAPQSRPDRALPSPESQPSTRTRSAICSRSTSMSTSLLPADDASYGFDNIAGVLKMSPTLMERYLSAAQKISRLAVGTPALLPERRHVPASGEDSPAGRSPRRSAVRHARRHAAFATRSRWTPST